MEQYQDLGKKQVMLPEAAAPAAVCAAVAHCALPAAAPQR